MTSPFDSKNHIATALDRLALRLLLFMLCVFYFFYLWHSGVSSLIAGSALFLLVLLFILLLERRTLTTRDHALRVRIGGAIALEELLVLPSEQAAQSICTLLCESLGAKPLGSAKLLYDGQNLSGTLCAMSLRLKRERRRCAFRSSSQGFCRRRAVYSCQHRRFFSRRPARRRMARTACPTDFRQTACPALWSASSRNRRRNRPTRPTSAFTLYPTAYSGSCAVPRKAETLSALRSPAHGLLLDVWFVLRADFRYRFLCAGDALRQKESQGVQVVVSPYIRRISFVNPPFSSCVISIGRK